VKPFPTMRTAGAAEVHTLGALIAVAAIACASALGGIDLVTLPGRDSVQLTIYNSADLTLVREVRRLTLNKGINRLSFGWANTLIDPTSLDLRATQDPDKVRLLDVAYPPRLNTVGIWTVESDVAGEVPVEIRFFTSGISWRAFYMATLTTDESRMSLEGFVRVTNNSGEDYPNAQTRLIVGKVHLLDQIAALARRKQPYGRPRIYGKAYGLALFDELASANGIQLGARLRGEKAREGLARMRPKKIVKEGLSEYFLYTIEGTETISHGWAKRLPSFRADSIPVVNLYKYEEERYGRNVIRFLHFKNDKAHDLGETPLPGGLVKVYRTIDRDLHLSYVGADNTKYIPVEQKVELNLGPAREVSVDPKMMDIEYEDFHFDRRGNIDGWIEVQTWQVEVKNQRAVPVRVEVMRNLRHAYWTLARGGDYATFERDDKDTIKFTLDLKPHSAKLFRYVVRYQEGERRQGK